MNDELGTRMKEDFENRTRIFLPRRSYTLIRVDGKAFHTYTKGLKRPFDDELMDDMDSTAQYLCENISGARFAFVQSDEITILITDFENEGTQAWFDNNLQKMCSISASMATAKFNELRFLGILLDENSKIAGKPFDVHNDLPYDIIQRALKRFIPAQFDSRVWQIPSRTEVYNNFVWRQQDATRNSIQSVAQSLYKHQELNGKNTSELQEMIFQKGINWNDYAPKYKRGRMISKEKDRKVICDLKSPENEQKREQVKKSSPDDWFVNHEKNEFCIRTKVWKNIEVPIFTQDKEFLDHRIPRNMENITIDNG